LTRKKRTEGVNAKPGYSLRIRDDEYNEAAVAEGDDDRTPGRGQALVRKVD
jgi:hypothetical protein